MAAGILSQGSLYLLTMTSCYQTGKYMYAGKTIILPLGEIRALDT